MFWVEKFPRAGPAASSHSQRVMEEPYPLIRAVMVVFMAVIMGDSYLVPVPLCPHPKISALAAGGSAGPAGLLR